MNHLFNSKIAAWIIAGISLLTLFGLGWMLGRDLTKVSDLLKTVPMVITVDLVVAFLFQKWFWKWSWLRHWLVFAPNLNGTWRGEIRSSWINPETGKGIDPIPAVMTIRQALNRLSCVVRTGEMKSFSFIAGLVIAPEEQKASLAYSYDSDPIPSVRDRSQRHKGTAFLEIHESNPMRLEGEYWTERNTIGEMEFALEDRKMKPAKNGS